MKTHGLELYDVEYFPEIHGGTIPRLERARRGERPPTARLKEFLAKEELFGSDQGTSSSARPSPNAFSTTARGCALTARGSERHRQDDAGLRRQREEQYLDELLRS